MTAIDAVASLRAALLPRYAVERELGRGGMATVYLAEDLSLHRHVALKVLHRELASSLGRERFLREIEIAAHLTHPHILALHDSGEADGRPYFAMPYVQGESLRQRLEREGQLAVAEVLEIVRAVAGALSHAHSQGVVHRDIKPENILLARGEGGASGVHPLVADFGIARALDVAGGERLTSTGLVLGTPAYMSPEQAAAGGRLDARSDIYALGCVAYEMLAGTPPFTGPTTRAIMARHAVDPVPPLHTVRATVPPAVEAAIERALAKVPADRFATAAEFADALVAEPVPFPLLGRRLASRHSRIVLGVLAGVAVIGVGTWILRGSPGPPLVHPSAASIAVLPLVSATSDTALTRLGRDLAVTISASLDGVGGVETADRLRVANETAESPGLSPAEGAELARRLGSGSLVRGTLVRAGENVRLDLGLYGSTGLAPLAGGITVTGNRDSIGALTDSVTWSLLRNIWRRGEPPSPSLAAVTTRSLPALRAFLDGERALGANRWDEASLAFRSAIEADSTFGLAHFRYALTRFWTLEPLEPAELETLRTHRTRLPERERLLVDAFLKSGNAPRLKIERHETAVRRFPDYWPAWFLYADALYHWGPIDGHDWSEGLQAFRRVVALNPDLVPAWEHIFNVTLGREQAEAEKIYARLIEMGWLASQPPGGQLISRLLAGVGSAGGALRPDMYPLADSTAEFMVSSRGNDLPVEFSPIFLLQEGFPAAQLELNRRALATGRAPPQVSTALRAANAWAWAARGRWDSALATMSAAAAEPDVRGMTPLAFQEYGLAVLGSVLGATAPALADRRRRRVVAYIDRLTDKEPSDFSRVRLAWLDGVLGFARGDRHQIETARKQIAANQWENGKQLKLVARSLAALDRALAGDRKRAGQELASLEEYCIGHEDCGSLIPDIAIQRLLAAQWLAEAGDLEHARRLLRWQDAPWRAWPWILGHALGGPSYLIRARIEETRGDTAHAAEYYRQFVRRYDQPMPSQAHLVVEAKGALARLKVDR